MRSAGRVGGFSWRAEVPSGMDAVGCGGVNGMD